MEKHYEYIDGLLKIYCKTTNASMQASETLVLDKKIVIDDNIRNSCLDKLLKDGYVATFESTEKRKGATFEGMLFSLNGGYIKQRKVKKDLEKANAAYDTRMENNARYLYIGTWALAVGTFGIIAWEMWHYFYGIH